MKIILLLLSILLLNCKSTKNKNETNILLGLLILNQSNNKANTSSSSIVIPEDTADTVNYAPNHNGDSGGFRDKSKAINGIRGAGNTSGSLDVFSLAPTGEGASIVLEWSGKRVLNGNGIDFVIFENAFLYNNNPNTAFMEPLIVEVSNDNINYCGFSPNYTFSPETTYNNNPSNWSKFAGITPVLYNIETNPLTGEDLYNSSKAGGDGFDLDNLSSANDFNIGCNTTLRDQLKTNGFLYLRLTAATARTNPDTGANFLQDTGAFNLGPDIDGVIARYRSSR